MKFSKKLLSLLLATVLLIGTVMPVFAASVQPRWTNMTKFDIYINKAGGTYSVNVSGVSKTTKIEVTANLYESRTAGYTKVDGFTASRNSASLTASDSYSFNTSKLYKVVATAKVTANGITETVTLEKTA
ncbi:MAG: hypothetical protein IJN77_05850 [Oscillospiraceae bacterium]|nr:hypothetical protein [Oscillospiraceae bacterium]